MDRDRAANRQVCCKLELLIIPFHNPYCGAHEVFSFPLS
jgi:hypothetical protein